MDVCLRVLKESNKSRFDSYKAGTVYWSYSILPFGIVACTYFPTTFLKIAVYKTDHSRPLSKTSMHDYVVVNHFPHCFPMQKDYDARLY